MEVTIQVGEEFKRQFKHLAKKYHSLLSDFKIFKSELKLHPYQGDDLGHRVRKVRMQIASKGKGKSGGARIITYNITEGDESIEITLLTIYDKNEMENISDEFIKSLIRDFFGSQK